MMSEYSQDCPYTKELHHKVFTHKGNGNSLIFINQPYFDQGNVRFSLYECKHDATNRTFKAKFKTMDGREWSVDIEFNDDYTSIVEGKIWVSDANRFKLDPDYKEEVWRDLYLVATKAGTSNGYMAADMMYKSSKKQISTTDTY